MAGRRRRGRAGAPSPWKGGAALTVCGLLAAASVCGGRPIPDSPEGGAVAGDGPGAGAVGGIEGGASAGVQAAGEGATTSAAAVAAGGEVGARGGVDLPEFYHSLEEVVAEVRRLVEGAGEGVTLEEVPIAYEPGGETWTMPVVRVARSLRERPHKVLASFGEHGREFITTEVALEVVRRLAAAASGEGGDPAAAEALASTEFTLAVVANPAGRRVAETVDVCGRVNGRGVDVNRNWPVDWGIKDPGYDAGEENPGAAPLSEPETRALMTLALDTAPDVWVSVHSGMAALFHPWDGHVGEVEHEHDRVKALLDAVKRQHCARGGGHALGGAEECVVGAASAHVGYLAHGTGTDTMHALLKVPMASTWEIYGVTDAGYDECMRMFNPVDETGFRGVRENWGAAFLTAAATLDDIKARFPWDAPDLASAREAVVLISGGWAARNAHWAGLLAAVAALMAVCTSPMPKQGKTPALSSPTRGMAGRGAGAHGITHVATTRHRSPLPRRSQQVDRGGTSAPPLLR